jgi:NTP pyrophosphatase (non-canonical NTP hydrolase)
MKGCAMMEINEYQKLALRTANTKCLDLRNCGLGLCGESGEAADIIKKHVYHGHDLNKDKLIYELGDICWYIAVTAELLGVSLEEVMQRNVEKLKQRYPNGFEKSKSINRVI